MKPSTALIYMIAITSLLALATPTRSQAKFSRVICNKEVSNDDANAIVRSVFDDKFQGLVDATSKSKEVADAIPATFIQRNTGLKFTICDNVGSFDSSAVYGTGVVFDVKLMGLLMAQARALIIGATVNPGDPFALHERLMKAFITEGAVRSINPIEQVKQDALAAGMKESDYIALLDDDLVKSREQELFLISLNFLSLHERCHFGLDHGARVREILRQDELTRFSSRQELELDADRCAVRIINVDERKFASSPISYFGLVMTVTTQIIVSTYFGSPETSTHPSGRIRLAKAEQDVLRYVDAQQDENTDIYKKTIRGFGAQMAKMLDFADQTRESRLRRGKAETGTLTIQKSQQILGSDSLLSKQMKQRMTPSAYLPYERMLFGIRRCRADGYGTSQEGTPGCVHAGCNGIACSPRR